MTIEEIMNKENIPFCMVVNTITKREDCIGDKKNFATNGLLDMINTNNRLEDLIRSLDGQILPTHWTQGEEKMMICNPKKNIFVILCYFSNDSILDRYDMGVRINDELGKIEYK
ncbi:hypothetical protein SAMN05216584_1302 [Selenomonas sp. WCT3]|uniref:hypothetical protein n=1 Tax=Selenomonas sp. WCT3 TaxID=3158785 RepID=UPI00088D5829|nr:hypothetical protein SAMN05216584_1302 [Selenomonas ruminantium]